MMSQGGRLAQQLLPGVALAVVLAAVAGWWFLGSGKTSERSVPEPAAQGLRTPPGATVAPPPFHVKGTMLAGTTRTAIVSVLGVDGTEGPEQRVREGDMLEGYQLIRIAAHRVYFERDGARFLLIVGSDRRLPPQALPADAPLPPERNMPNMRITAPPPGADVEQARRQLEKMFDQMRQDPQVMEAKERRRQMQERQSRDASPAPSPGPGAVPP